MKNICLHVFMFERVCKLLSSMNNLIVLFTSIYLYFYRCCEKDVFSKQLENGNDENRQRKMLLGQNGNFYWFALNQSNTICTYTSANKVI